MKNMEWKEKVGGFKKIDVRDIAGNFLEGLKNQAAKLPVGEGLSVPDLYEERARASRHRVQAIPHPD